MTSLLPDLYAEITSHCTRGTLFQLCGCSRAWYSVAALQLYSTVSGELDAAAFLRTIATNEWLGSKVRFLTIHWDSDEAHLFAPALRNMPNLEHLRAYNLARACEADQVCVDTLLSLKNLQSISWCWCESFDLDEVLDRLPPLHRIAWEWDGHPSRALDRLVARSHAVLQTLKLEDYPLENVVNRLANSVVFSQLTTIDMFKISLGTLTGGRFPALRKIKSQYITDLGLLRDSAFLPMLRSVRLACNYGLEDTMGLPDSDSSGHSRTPLRSDRHLSFLKLDTSDINPAIAGAADLAGPGDEAINKFGLYLEPFNLSKLSSLSLFFDTPDQIELVMGFLGGILADEHALRVLAVQLGRHDDSFTSVRRLPSVMHANHSQVYR